MNRTPVLILNELMVRRNITPHYELLTSEGINTHMTVFHYRVTAGEVIAYGKARAKKDAKHEAAKLALEKFAELGIYHPVHPTPPSPIKTLSAPSSPVHMQVNAISSLHEMCSENNIPTPEFVLISDIGPAHFRLFTMECKIANMIVSATDTTKKKAKQLAAHKMLHRLMDTLPEVLAEFKSSDTLSTLPAILPPEDVLAAYNDLSQLNKRKINWGLKISSYPFAIKNLMKEKHVEHGDLWKDANEKSFQNFKNLLGKLGLSMNLTYLENGNNIIACITINSEPEFVMADINPSKDDATARVLEKAYDFLAIMSK